MCRAITLTTGLDSGAAFTGGSANDIFNSVLQAAGAAGTTVAPGDNLTGGAGTDILNISVAGSAGAAYTLSAVATNDIEKVLLSQFDTDGANATTVDASLMSGVTTVGLSASAAEGDTVFTGLKNGVTAEMRNGSADLSVSYTDTVMAGEADTQALTLSAASGGTFTSNGAETIAITSELAKSKLTNVASNTLKTVKVAGDAALEITTALTSDINASTFTGALNIKLGTATQSVTGGVGNDVIDASTNLSNVDTINAGAGTDTLKLSVGDATVAVGTNADKGALFNVSGFEVIEIASTNNNAALNLDNISGVTNVAAAARRKTVVLDANASDTTKNSNSVAIGFILNGVAYTTAAAGSSATSGEAAILLRDKINTIPGFSATATGATIVITSTTGPVEFALTSGHTEEDSQSYNNVSFANMAVGQVVDIFSAANVTAGLKDPSGTADVLSINLKTTSDDKGYNKNVGTVTANNVETINLSASGMSDGKVTSIAALTGNAAKTLNITGDSDVTISAFTSSTALVTIDGSTASGDLNLAAAPAAKDQSIKTGSGNDTIKMGAFLTAADTIDGGANNVPAGETAVGKDKLTATGNIGTVTTPAALKIANVETIEVANGGTASTYIDAAAVTGAETLAFSATGGTVKITNLAAGTKIGLGETSSAFTGTMDISLADATGAADSISFTTTSAGNAAPTVALTISSAVETVNIAATTESANAATATFNNTNNAAKNIVLTSGHASDIVALGTLNAATTNVDASSLVSKMTVTTAAAGAVTVSANGTVNNNVVAGGGNDTITLAGKLGTTVQSIDGGAGTDVLNVQASSLATDFTSVSNVETINITVAGNTQAGFNDGTKDNGLNAAGTVNILGGDALSTFTIATAVLDDDAAGTTMKFDASKFAGAIDINVASDAYDAELSILGGASTDDKVTIIIAGEDNKVALMSGVETLVINSTNSDTSASVDLTDVTGLVTVDAQFVNVANLDQIKIDKLAAGVKVKTTITDDGDNLVVNLASISGTSDALDLELTAFSDTGATNERLNFDAAGIETLNLVMKNSDTGTLDLAGVTATTDSTLTVNVSGSGVAEITALSDSANTVVSTGTGNLKIGATARAATAMTITGGEGNDSIAMENAADVLRGGLGTDTLAVSLAAILGGIEVNLGATDQVVSINGSANSAVQSGFENVDLSSYTGFGAVVTGSTGANTIVGTGSADQINGGNGADFISGLGGNDSIDLAETTAAADTVIFSATFATNGTDTITGFGTGDKIDLNAMTTTSSYVTTAGTTQNVFSGTGSQAIEIGANALYVLTGAAAGTADTASNAATAITAAANWTNASNGTLAYFVVIDNNSSSVFSYLEAGGSEVVAAELTYMGTIDAVLTTAQIVIA